MKAGERTDGRNRVEALVREVEAIQGNLGDLVRELDQRRRSFFDLRGQLRRHPLIVVGSAAGLVALVSGTAALVVRRRRRQQTIAARWARLQEAVARMRAHPERLAERQPNVGRKIAGAGGAAAASVLGRRLAKQLFGAS